MKYIKTYENFKPITINSAKPFKVKNGLLKNAIYLQKGIKSDRKRLEKEKDPHKRTKLNNDKNFKIRKLKDISFKTLKQAEYLKNNPIKENLKEKKILIEVLESPDFKPEDIVNYIGLDEKDYKIDFFTNYRGQDPEYYDDKLKLFMKAQKLDDILDKEEGIINYILKLDAYYNDYDFYVDKSELDYIGNYLPKETITEIKKFANLFNFSLKLDEDGDIEIGEIYKLFKYLGLKSNLEDFRNEISNENTRAVEKLARYLIKSLPFNLSFEYTGNFDIELEFNYKDIIDYMKENKLEVYSIKELLENISEFNDFSYEIEYNGEKDEYLEGFKDLIKEVDNVIENYIISPDDIFPKLIAIDNLKAFQENFDKAIFNYNYDVSIDYNSKRLDLFRLAKHYKGKILQWFISPEFEKKLKEEKSEAEFENYEQFMYKENAAKYNI